MTQEKKLLRPSEGRMLGGVCAGVARYFSLDPTIVRIIVALLTVFTAFSGLIVYLILWIVMPDERKLEQR